MDATDVLKLSEEVKKSQRKTKILDHTVNQLNNERVADIYVRNVRKFQEFQEKRKRELKKLDERMNDTRERLAEREREEKERRNRRNLASAILLGTFTGGALVGGITTGVTYSAIDNSQRHQTKNKIVNNNI